MSASPDQPADLVLSGGRIATMDPAHSWASALAVRDGRLATVGPDRAVMAHIGPRTRVIHLRGRTVTPGFQDAHVHPVHGGLARLRCELHDTRGREAYLAVIAAYAAAHPTEAWIRGGGWYMDDFPGGTPRREDLDAIAPDRPVFLTNRDGHGAWANSRALELAGVTVETSDPGDGRIERDADGSPTGTLHEGAMDLVGRYAPDDTPADLEAALLLGQAYLHSLGITAWQDAIIRPETEEQAYLALASRGELTARVVGAMWWERHRGAEQIEEFVERRRVTSIGRYQATSVKLMMDGVLENFTGAMLEPYLDGSGGTTDNRGLLQIDPDGLSSWMPQLDALGFQAHFHAIGDGAVRASLDAVAAARHANGASDTRPHIAHIQVIHPDDVPRFRLLDVAANAQPYWACHEGQMDNLTIPFLGDRWRWQYPFRSLRAAGAVLAMGSDWSVSTPDPLLEMELAVERVADESRGQKEPLLPEERLDLIDALAAFTTGSAYVNHLDGDTGTLEVRKLADFAVLDRDLFDREAGAIGETRVVGTFVEGAAVFEDPAL
ncbi:MAG: amidohydrolase, partial [Chloroflexi bacterium]|nr:amidohydrolase [Chloroflexota bacterium]